MSTLKRVTRLLDFQDDMQIEHSNWQITNVIRFSLCTEVNFYRLLSFTVVFKFE